MVASSGIEDVLNDIKVRVRTRSLARQLASLTGLSKEEAVLGAIEERVARLTGPASREERIGRALATLDSERRPHGDRRLPSREGRDRALGYGEEGV
jgi:hypothetical protein